MRLRAAMALLLVAGLTGPSSGQAPPPPAPQTIDYGVEASRVLLDVIVRDGKDNPVTDLKAEDFEVYEDGVRQQLDLFDVFRSARVATDAPEPSEPEAPVPAPAPRRPGPPDVNLIALVFDRLSPEARNYAKDAALTYLESGHPESDRVGVFLIDLSLITLASYTNDAETIREAIEHAGERAVSGYASSRGRQRDLTSGVDSGGSPAPAGGGGAAAGAAAAAAGAAAGAASVTAQLQEMQLRMLQSFESLERDQQGYATSNGLLAVVNSMRLLPGRKTVVFFSEGLSIPSNVQAHFSAVISEANRANVSVYAMDAAGLRIDSAMAETRREMLAQAREQARQRGSGRDFTGGAMSKQLERNEDLLRLNPHSGLGQLANETGGFLVRETNDLKTGFRRIDADMRFYYMLGYEPTNQAYDGRFRKVEVKVRRSGTKVRSRKGYFAVRQREDDSRPVLPFEAPALALLDRDAQANAFPTWARGLSFPEPERPGLTPILVEVPGNVLTFAPDDSQKGYVADIAIVARIKDENGRVVDRLSHGYRMSGPLDKMDAARAGEVLFYREAELRPGRYTVEAIAYDATADKGSVRSSELVVPEAPPGRLRLSSIAIVKKVEQVPETERNPANPLSFGELLLYPNLGEPIRKSTRKELTFFFTVYGARSGAQAPRAQIAILRGGSKLAQAAAELPAADASGRIQHVLGIPLGQFPAGRYELQLAVEDDRGRAENAVAFDVEE